jgi:hypothetical protein
MMIGLGVLLVYALYEVFVSTDLVRVSRSLFRLSAAVCLILMLFAERAEVYVGAAFFFGMVTLVCIWSFRSEVQGDDPPA